MRVFDRSCETVESAGARRGAQMGVLRCDHPDIEEFIHAKDRGDLKNFNISVGVTDAFMQAVRDGGDVELVHRAEPGAGAEGRRRLPAAATASWVYRKLPARELWDQVMRVDLRPRRARRAVPRHHQPRQQPRVLRERSPRPIPVANSRCRPTAAAASVRSTSTRFVRRPFEADAAFDEAGFEQLVRTAVRMLDNVLDVTMWPLPQQQDEARHKRRVGLGFTGLGDALVMLNLRYDGAAGAGHGTAHRERMRDTRLRRFGRPGRSSAARSRSSTPTCTCPAAPSRRACRSR